MKLYIAPTNTKGQGVFAKQTIAKDEVIEICPIIVLSPDDKTKIWFEVKE